MMFFKKSTIDALIVGLGNPGDKYKNNRHNIGFIALDYIADSAGEAITKRRFDGLCREINLDGKRILLLKPQTFMNNSGLSVKKAMSFYKLPINRVSVIYDEAALPTAQLRVRLKGSAAGHNGIKSIIAHCGEEFCRLRIGVGAHEGDMARHVLSDFSKSDRNLLSERMEDILSFVTLFSKGEVDKGMNLYSK